MNQIVLTEEQAKIGAGALKPVQVCDGRGNLLGTIEPLWTEAAIAEAKRILASDVPWHTAAQVLKRLQSLEKK